MAKKIIYTQEGNSKVRKVSTESIMRAAAFQRGFKDVKKGKPFAEDIRDPREQWGYERGRLFACVFDGQVKQGRYVTREAILAYQAARQSNLIS